MKVSFITLPNPDTDSTAFYDALNANFDTIVEALERVADRTTATVFEDAVVFVAPQVASHESRARVMNGTIRTVDP